jgi:hypothetical protein
VKAAGLSLAVPVTWLALDPKSPQVDAKLQQVVNQNPELSDVLREWDAIRSQVKLWAIDAGATSHAANLVVGATPFARSDLRHQAQVTAALEAMLGSNISSVHVHKVEVGGVRALELEATVQLNDAHGVPVTAYSSVLLLPTRKGVIDLDYSSPQQPSADTTLPTIVQSIHLL